MDFDTIADRLGYSSRGAATKDLMRALEVRHAEQVAQAEVLRSVEAQRLDRLQAAAWAAALQGDLRAIETVVRIIDRRCRLLGLDAPARMEVLSIDAIDEQIRLLTGQLAVAGGEAEQTAGAPGADADSPDA
ncbi:hypothetical protein [Streptomyces sp. NPDC001404]|uniref:hypothetical protein n=1 Tax=Streptomyces sp. NPDC001404 TaxID=3364571 RepID=UPI0036B016A2